MTECHVKDPYIERKYKQIVLFHCLAKINIPKALIEKICKMMQLDFSHYLVENSFKCNHPSLECDFMTTNMFVWKYYHGYWKTCSICQGPCHFQGSANYSYWCRWCNNFVPNSKTLSGIEKNLWSDFNLINK
jgi:hypothetical protein